MMLVSLVKYQTVLLLAFNIFFHVYGEVTKTSVLLETTKPAPTSIPKHKSSTESTTIVEDILNQTEDAFPIPMTGRLPEWIKPINYEISLQVFLNNASYDGSIKMSFQVANATDKVVLSMVDLVTKNETCRVTSLPDGSEEIFIKNQSYNSYLQFYIIHLNETLINGRSYLVEVDFRGTLNSKLVGFYLSSYKDEQGNDIRVASTQFSPTDARRAFPCLDEPGFKATFDLSIERDENVTSLSNMPLQSTEAVFGKPGRFVDRFGRTPKMSTYIVGFLVSDFEYLSSDALNNTQFRVWSRKEAINQTEYSLEVGPKLLLYLEDYFGFKYPLPKLDMAAIPNFKFNGMENWGLIMYRESAVLFDPKFSTIFSKRKLIGVVAHEIAHMWFGNLVTPKWWSELWLKEGFATFMGYKAVDSVEPSWKMMDYLVQGSTGQAFALDGLRSSHPINVHVDHPDRISEIFDEISYSKGACIIRMMQHFLSEEVYKSGMRAYVHELQYKNAVQEDLWRFLTEAWRQSDSFLPGRTVEKIMNSWTLQDGFPVVNVERNVSQAYLTQERFLLEEIDAFTPSSGNQSLERKWWIPISFVKESKPFFNITQPEIWMTPEEDVVVLNDLPSENEWFILNVQKAGFYRVNYDPQTWELLLQQLMTDYTVIHSLNRAQLLDDAFNLARCGRVNYSLPLQMAKYIKNEDDLTPFQTLLDSFMYIYKMAKTSRDIALFDKYILDLIIPLYNKTGFSDSPNDSYAIQTFRILATKWACTANYQPCVSQSKNLFDQWLLLPSNESANVISSNVKPTVLCTGIKYGSPEAWNATFDKYFTSNVQTEKTDILIALGCTNDTEILTRYLEMSLDPSSGILKQDIFYIFGGVSSTVIGRDLAWKTIKEKWRYILEYFGSGSSTLWRIFKAPTNTFGTQELVDELENFRQVQKDYLGSAARTVDLSLERANINKDWMQHHFPFISNWLKAN